jgi:NADH dehydrogenase FAD-containing subunit
MATGTKRILILGGGFAGVYTARTLRNLTASAAAIHATREVGCAT